jgi:hypothetical protein
MSEPSTLPQLSEESTPLTEQPEIDLRDSHQKTPLTEQPDIDLRDNHQFQSTTQVIESDSHEIESNTSDYDQVSRPHRSRRPPEKLSLRWDNSQSYE